MHMTRRLVLTLAMLALLPFSSATADAAKIRIPPTILTPREPRPRYKWRWNGGEIKYDTTSGQLHIPSLSESDEGLFACFTTTTFDNEQYAVAVSAPVEIRVARVGEFTERSIQYYTVGKGKYVKLPCDKDPPVHYGSTAFKWYKVQGHYKEHEILMNDRIFIDQEGKDDWCN